MHWIGRYWVARSEFNEHGVMLRALFHAVAVGEARDWLSIVNVDSTSA